MRRLPLITVLNFEHSKMIHLKDGLYLNPFLQYAVVLLLLTHSCGGQSQMVGPTQPIVAMVGDDIILPCHLEPAEDVVYRAVEWARADLKPRFVHVRRDGVELLIDQNPSYIGRTSMSINKLKCGDISLKLSKVKLSDEGMYKCHIPELKRASTVQLVVGAVSSPGISIAKDISGAAVLLQCESKGWYPKPGVSWLDGEGNLFSAGPTETVRGADGLYTVSSRVTVEKRHSNSFTCTVQQKNIGQTRHTYIHVADNVFMVPSCFTLRVGISLAACLVSTLTAVFIVWKCRRNKTNAHHKDEAELGKRAKSTSFSDSMKLQSTSEEKDKEQLMKTNETVDLEKKNTNFSGRSLKNKGHLEEVVMELKSQKTDLKNHEEKLNSQLKEVKTKIEENKEKLDNPAAWDRERKQNKRKKTKQDLERRRTELEELLEDTHKLLETTSDLIIRMTEMNSNREE